MSRSRTPLELIVIRLGCIVLVTLLAVTTSPLSPRASGATSFKDVPPGTQFYDDIMWLADRGVTQGWSDGTYRPGLPVARDAMAAFMYRLAGSPVYTPSGQRFRDVPPGTPFYKEISWLADRGVTTGYADGTYRPLASVNRDAMAAFMYRLSGSPTFTDTQQRFTDVPPNTQFYKEINWLAYREISTGWPDGTFRPVQPVLRDAMAAFMHRLWLGWERDATPSLSEVRPSMVTIQGGTRVAITGSRLAGATSVMFGNLPGTALTVISNTRLEVTTPRRVAGRVDVTVQAGGRLSNQLSMSFVAARLESGAKVTGGDGLVSSNGAYHALVQPDGNLVVRRASDGAVTYATNTSMSRPALMMLADGNLVLRDGDGAGTVRWATTTDGYGGALLDLRDDGVLVVSRGGRALWQSDYGIRYDRMLVNEVLRDDQFVRSPNHAYRLVMQRDGNLVLYREGGGALWATGTSGPGRLVVMQSDGNLVIYAADRPVWASDTPGHPGATLRVQNDGRVVLYQGGTPIWSVPGGGGGSEFRLPFGRGQQYRITQGPSQHANGPYPDYNRHAVDFAMSIGTPILASADGTISFEGYASTGEIQVRIDHGSDRCSQYAHLSRTIINKGDRVRRGQLIGYSGNTGISVGPHLHWNMVYCSTQRSREVINSAEMGTNYPVGMSAPSQNG